LSIVVILSRVLCGEGYMQRAAKNAWILRPAEDAGLRMTNENGAHYFLNALEDFFDYESAKLKADGWQLRADN
jgi:hypothetical protein